jgi:hypothetical protein
VLRSLALALTLGVVSAASLASVGVPWATQVGSTSLDLGLATSALSDGSAIVAGKFSGTATFGSTTLTSAGSDDVFVAKIDASGTYVWATQAGGTSNDFGYAVSTLSDGSAIVTGQFRSTATFGSTTLTSAGDYDVFVAKIDASGTYLWATKAGSTSADSVRGVSTLSDGSAIATGYFQGTATFGSTTLTSAGSTDIFVAKFSYSDSEPDAFSFTDQTDVAVSTQITSNTITVAGITSAAAISVTGGEYAINGGSYTSDAGTVENGNTVTVRHTSSGSFSTATNTTLTISEVSDTFTSTTVSDHPACLEPLNVGTIGTAGNCEGLLIVDRGMLNDAKNDGTYAITASNGVAYTFGDSQYNIYTGQVTNLSSLFQNTAFNEDIEYWEVANVTTFQSMFQFNGTFRQDLSNWKVTNKTTSIRGMFNHSGAADQNLSGWDVSQVTDFFAAFASDHSKWSPANYDATLNAWAQRDYPPMLDSNGDPRMRYVPSYSYFTSEGTAARDALIDKGFVFQNDDVTTDVTPPELASTTPTNGATGVGIDTDITLTFTESVSRLGANRPNGNIVELVRSSDDQIIETFSTNSRVVSTSFTLDPSNDLDEGTSYYIRISPIAFYDSSNNPFPGILNKTSYSFQTVAPLASQTINFDQPYDDEITMGSATLSATASSGLAVAFASNTVDVCSASGTTATYLAIGTCTIVASQAGNATHAAAPTVTRSFQITKATQTITFAQPSDDELTSSVVILSASASSGLPVSYSSSTPDICSVAGAKVSYIAIGACTVTASQPGDNTYAAANNVTRSFNITDADSDEDGIGDSEDDFPLADTEETSGEVTLQTTPSAANSSCTIDSLAVATAATESPGVAVNGIGKGISFALSGCDTSNLETLTISIDLGTAPAEGSVAMKIDRDGNWSQVKGSNIEGSVVTYTITDDGPLDEDPDPGKIGDPITVAVPYVAPALPVATLPTLALGLLSLLLGLFGYRRLAH